MNRFKVRYLKKNIPVSFIIIVPTFLPGLADFFYKNEINLSNTMRRVGEM